MRSKGKQLATYSYTLNCLEFTFSEGGPKLVKGDQFWLPKLVRLDRFWRRTDFSLQVLRQAGKADEIWVDFEILKLLYRLNYLEFYFV